MREEREAALLLGARSDELHVELSLGPVEAADASGIGPVVRGRVRVPLGELVFEERGGHFEASIELTFVAMSASGARSDPRSVRVPLRIPKSQWETARGGVWTYEARLAAAGGSRRYVVTLRDLASNRVGSAEASARVE